MARLPLGPHDARPRFVSAVVYPAVSPGHARLRLCATAAHQPHHFERLFSALEQCRELDDFDEAIPAEAS